MEERAAAGALVSSPRVLVVRFSAIGDCVMAAFAATAIREKHPDAHITWACENRCEPVLDRELLVNQVLSFPRERWKKDRWSLSSWREQLVTYSRLRQHSFDFGLDLQGHSKTALCLRLANPKRRVAANATDALAQRLTPPVARRPKGTHMVVWAIDTLNRLGEFPFPRRPIMPIPIGVLPPEPLPQAYVALSVSAGQARNVVPAATWRSVATDLVASGIRVVLLGGPEARIEPIPGVIDLVGKTTLVQTIAILRGARVHVGGDTGTGHIAAAYGRPTVSVFGFADPEEFKPYSDLGLVLKEGDTTDSVAPALVTEATLHQWRLAEWIHNDERPHLG
ncbi:MAG: glycosyltransferase family 9 protein [Fimbriimonas sp.]